MTRELIVSRLRSRTWLKAAAVAAGGLVAVVVVFVNVARFGPDKSEASGTPFGPGQVIHNVVEYSSASLETGVLEVRTEESWTLVGDNNTVSKLRVLLRDSEGNVLQDGFIDVGRSLVGTYFAPNGQSGGFTVTREQPRPPSVLMWTEGQLAAEGFVRTGLTLVAGRQAAIYERVSPFAFDPGSPDESIDDYPYLKQFVGPTEIVQRVYVGVSPFGLDLGER